VKIFKTWDDIIPWILIATGSCNVIANCSLMAEKFWLINYGSGWQDAVDYKSVIAAKYWGIFFVVVSTSHFAGILKFVSNAEAVLFRSIGILAIWIWGFLLCYDGFTGPMSLHHDSQFEIGMFIRFLGGIFPIVIITAMVYFAFGIKEYIQKHDK
jgi:hypothetical protein